MLRSIHPTSLAPQRPSLGRMCAAVVSGLWLKRLPCETPPAGRPSLTTVPCHISCIGTTASSAVRRHDPTTGIDQGLKIRVRPVPARLAPRVQPEITPRGATYWVSAGPGSRPPERRLGGRAMQMFHHLAARSNYSLCRARSPCLASARSIPPAAISGPAMTCRRLRRYFRECTRIGVTVSRADH